MLVRKGSLQRMTELEVHAIVKQVAGPTLNEGLKSLKPKFRPIMVADNVLDMAQFSSIVCDMTGASNVKCAENVPILLS